MYIQHIQGPCQSRLTTADHALSVVAAATTAVLSLERSYASPSPSLSLLFFLCRSPWPMLRTFAFSWFYMTSAFFLHNCVVYVRKFESHVQIVNRCAPWEISSCAENFVFQALWTDQLNCLKDNSSSRTTSKTPLFYCYVHVRFRGNVFTEPLIGNGLYNPVVILLRALPSNGRCLHSHRLAMGLYVTVFYANTWNVSYCIKETVYDWLLVRVIHGRWR
jgi:hypothetical protein